MGLWAKNKSFIFLGVGLAAGEGHDEANQQWGSTSFVILQLLVFIWGYKLQRGRWLLLTPLCDGGCYQSHQGRSKLLLETLTNVFKLFGGVWWTEK